MTKTPALKTIHLVSLAFRRASLNHIVVDPMAGKHIFTQNMVNSMSLNKPGLYLLGWVRLQCLPFAFFNV